MEGKKRARASTAGTSATKSPAAAASSADSASRTVFVSGIPYQADPDSLRKFFADCGEIEEIRAPRFQDTGRLMGYAHVTFVSDESTEAALKRDGAYMGERFLTVELSKPVTDGPSAALALSTKAKPPGCTTIFIKGVPYEADEEAVAAAFSRFGAIASTRLPRWGHTGKRKGHGYVQFSSEVAADAAVAAYRAAAGTADALTIGSRVVHLDFDDGAPRSSFKAPSGIAFYKSDEASAVAGGHKKAPQTRHASPTHAAAPKAHPRQQGAGTSGASEAKAAGGHYWPRAQITGVSSRPAAASAPPDRSAAAPAPPTGSSGPGTDGASLLPRKERKKLKKLHREDGSG